MLAGDINVIIKRKKLEQDWGVKTANWGGEQLYVKTVRGQRYGRGKI